jgi:competence protein ComEC
MRNENRTEDNHRPPLCASAPVLWSLIPVMLGIMAANAGPAWLLLGGLLFPGTAGIRTMRKHAWLSSGSYACGAILMLMNSTYPHPEWEHLPPREANAVIQVMENFNARKAGRVAGIGKILQTNLPFDTISNRTAAYYLESEAFTDKPPSIGQVFECTGVLTYLPFSPELDDYQTYLFRRDIFLTINRGMITGTGPGAPAMERIRQHLFHSGKTVLARQPEDEKSPGRVLASMMLGSRSLLSDQRIELYRMTGTYHLFAVSGLHVGGVALCLQGLCLLIRIRGKALFLLAMTGTWYYVWLTGSSPSAVRAGIMITCIGISRYLLRQPHLFPALALSAWIVLIIDPTQLFNLGFQLSYGVVASIVLCGLPVASYFRTAYSLDPYRKHPLPRWRHHLHRIVWATIDLSCISLSAGMASMPLIVEHFELFTPGGVFMGIVLNPLATFVIMTGCLAMLTGMVVPLVGSWIAYVTWPPIWCMESLLRVCLAVPGSVSERSWPIPGTGTALLITMLATAWALQAIRQRWPGMPPLSHAIPFLMMLCGLSFTQLNA